MGYGDDDSCDAVAHAADALWAKLGAFYRQFPERNKGKADPAQVYQANIVRDFQHEFLALHEALLGVYRLLEATDPEERREKLAQRRLMSRTINWVGTLKDLMTDEDNITAKWLEQDEITSHGQRRPGRSWSARSPGPVPRDHVGLPR
jgi:hypothetical protein